jgi:hypothetical protein
MLMMTPLWMKCAETERSCSKMYGGIEGLHKHMDEERPLLEAHGWKFVMPEDVARRRGEQHTPPQVTR